MEDVMIFTARIRDSLFTRINPLTKLLFLIVLSVLISIASTEGVFLITLFVILISIFDQLPITKLYKECIFFFILAIFIFFTDISNGYLYALSSSLKFLTIVLASLIFTDSTSPNETARSISSFLYPVLKERANSFAFLIELTLSMIPKILDTANKILDARKARGESFIKHPIKVLTGFSVTLFTHLFSQISAYADGLESRLYNTKARRKAPSYSYRDVITLLILLIVIGCVLWIR